MHVYQLVHTLNYGDAISGEALSIHRVLGVRGFTSKIYSVHAHEKVKQLITPAQALEADVSRALAAGEEVVVILHYSIASPLNELFCKLPGAKRALIYHNLTPPHWFEPYNARVHADLVKGRNELPELLKSVDFVLADSFYNGEELTQFGCEAYDVLPLALDESKWSVETNAGIAAALRAHGGVNILHVGRLAPNKCVEDIIKAFYFYHHKIDRNSRLWLVGIDIDTELYSFELRRLISRLHLKEAVQFVGSVADSELRAFYENSHVYVCMSEHEGFCLPLIEAMYFGLPVIAFDSTAVKDTVGEGGIVIQQKLAAEVAELINIVISDTDMATKLRAAGKRRASQFGMQQFNVLLEEKLLRHLSSKKASAKSGEGSPDASHWA